MNFDLNYLSEVIKYWAIERDLEQCDPIKQVLKLGEEYGELCEALCKSNMSLIEDSIGDIFVVLTILAMQMNTSIDKCVFVAYNEIKDRKGKMVNGVFVKEGDLK